MSEQQPQLKAPPKRRRSSRAESGRDTKRTKQDDIPPRPVTPDLKAWAAYWRGQGQPWRTEPEIDDERQKYLADRRMIQADLENIIFPFKDIQLNRSDIEWLLATHESLGIKGPVNWENNTEREREGMDLRGADLRQTNLQGLPLARMIGGVTSQQIEQLNIDGEEEDVVDRLIDDSAVHLDSAILYRSNLEGARLTGVKLTRARAMLARFDESDLTYAHFKDALLIDAHFEGARMIDVNLEGAVLQGAFFDAATALDGSKLADKGANAAWVADVRWGGTNLGSIEWAEIERLGDELYARTFKSPNWMRQLRLYLQNLRKIKNSNQALKQAKEQIKRERGKYLQIYEDAIRSYRQLALVLKEQGINEIADAFIFRAHLLQRKVFLHQHKLSKYLFSWFLHLLTGYGFRLWRIFFAYALVIIGFASAYHFLSTVYPPALPWNDAFVLSITAFHGRVFSSPFMLGSPQGWLTAFEAIFGLVIEGVFIAMLTQRFFNR